MLHIHNGTDGKKMGIDYIKDCKSFQQFTNCVINQMIELNKHTVFESETESVRANIIIADPKIYDLPDLILSNNDIGYINLLSFVNVTLIESVNDLITILMSHYVKQSQPQHQQQRQQDVLNLPEIDQHTQVIGIFGIFEYFVSQGKDLLNNAIDQSFLSIDEFNGQTINYVGNLLYNVTMQHNYKVIVADGESCATNSTEIYNCSLWNESIPNLSMKFDTRIPLGLVLSKWMQC